MYSILILIFLVHSYEEANEASKIFASFTKYTLVLHMGIAKLEKKNVWQAVRWTNTI